MANARLNVFEDRYLATDDDVWRAIDDLKEERDRFERILQYIADYEPRNGDRIQAFASVRWYARTCLDGTMSPGPWKRKKTL